MWGLGVWGLGYGVCGFEGLGLRSSLFAKISKWPWGTSLAGPR